MPSAWNNKRKAICGPSACNKKNSLGSRQRALSTIVLFSFVPCFLHSTRYVNDSPFLFVVPGTRYHTYAIQQRKHLVPGIKIWMLIILIHTWYQLRGNMYDTPYVRHNGYVRNQIFQLIYWCYRWTWHEVVPQPESWLWYQREIPVLAWTSPVQLEDISRAS